MKSAKGRSRAHLRRDRGSCRQRSQAAHSGRPTALAYVFRTFSHRPPKGSTRTTYVPGSLALKAASAGPRYRVVPADLLHARFEDLDGGGRAAREAAVLTSALHDEPERVDVAEKGQAVAGDTVERQLAAGRVGLAAAIDGRAQDAGRRWAALLGAAGNDVIGAGHRDEFEALPDRCPVKLAIVRPLGATTSMTSPPVLLKAGAYALPGSTSSTCQSWSIGLSRLPQTGSSRHGAPGCRASEPAQ